MVSVEADYTGRGVGGRKVWFVQESDPFLILAFAAPALSRVAFHIQSAAWGLQPAVSE